MSGTKQQALPIHPWTAVLESFFLLVKSGGQGWTGWEHGANYPSWIHFWEIQSKESLGPSPFGRMSVTHRQIGMSKAADVQLRYRPEVYSRVKDEEEMELNREQVPHWLHSGMCTAWPPWCCIKWGWAASWDGFKVPLRLNPLLPTYCLCALVIQSSRIWKMLDLKLDDLTLKSGLTTSDMCGPRPQFPHLKTGTILLTSNCCWDYFIW